MARPRKNVKSVVEAVKDTTETVIDKVVEIVETFPKEYKLKDKSLHHGKHMIFLKRKLIVFENGKACIDSKETAETLKRMGVI